MDVTLHCFSLAGNLPDIFKFLIVDNGLQITEDAVFKNSALISDNFTCAF